MSWTPFFNNWSVKSGIRSIYTTDNGFFKKEKMLDFRHVPCYSNTMIINCLYEHQVQDIAIIECCICTTVLKITKEDFNLLTFAS